MVDTELSGFLSRKVRLWGQTLHSSCRATNVMKREVNQPIYFIILFQFYQEIIDITSLYKFNMYGIMV